jgi:hypothetical protein
MQQEIQAEDSFRMPQPLEVPAVIPLFPAFPPVTQLPVYAWRAYTSATTSITSSVTNPRPLSDIPTTIVAMIYYHNDKAPSDKTKMIRTIDYGDTRPYTFSLPDGTTRKNSSVISAALYQTLRNSFSLSTDTYPA